jgi:polygalacturonase
VRDVVVINEINQPGWHPKGAHVVWNNADGLNPDGCRRVVFEDLFLHTGDDAVAVKSMDPALNVSDVTVRRAIIWTPVAALKVGTESRGNTMSNIRFEDIHIARCGRALALDIFDRAVASDIVFRNLTIARAGQGLLFRAGKRSADQPGQGKIDGVLVENVSFHDSLPASAMETPLSEGGIGRVDLRNWSGPNGPARDASSARITGTDLAGSFNIQP